MLARHKRILKRLLNTNDYVSVTSLANDLQCSEKTVRNDLKALDDWLRSYPSLVIERKPSIGVLLKGDDASKKQLFRELLNDSEEGLSSNHRQLHLLKWLLTADRPITMRQLADQFYISKSTIHHDLEEIEEWLNHFGLKLIRKPNLGLKIQGKEKEWRMALSRLVELLVNRLDYILNEQQLNMIADVLQPYEVALIEKEIRQMEKHLDFPLTDQAVVSLTIHIAIAVKRIKKGYSIQMDRNELNELQTKKEYRLAEQLAGRVATWLAVKIPEAEIGYITLHLLGARVRYDQIQTKEATEQFLNKVDQEALNLASVLIESICNRTDERLRRDKELLLGLTLHLHATLNRLRNGFLIVNPMLKEIKQMYRYTFELVFSLVGEMERRACVVIPEDEVAYIVLHIQAALERLQNERHRRKRVVIVCPTGSGSSRLIEAKISTVFPDVDVVGVAPVSKLNSVIEAQKPDVLISTVPITKTAVPVITVSPLMRQHELQAIKDFLFHMQIRPKKTGQPYETIKQFMDRDLIFLDLALTDRFEVISYLAKNLYDRGYVEQGYEQSAKNRERVSSTYIGGGMAIPHGEMQLIKETVIAVARLRTPIDWGGEKVNLVLMIAQRLQENEQIKKLFHELANLSEDEDTLKKLNVSPTVGDFYQCL